MCLLVPSRVGDQVLASSEANDNLNKLLYADTKEKVVTRLAVRHFDRIKALSPGYFEGMKSWAKSGVIYLAAGTVTMGAIALSVYGLWQAITKTKYGPYVVLGLCGTGWVSHEFGYRPIEYVKALLAMAVRDSASRAADASIRNDERTWKSNETKSKESRDKILNELLSVYNDCAKELLQQYQQVDKSENVNERFALKQMVCRLEKRLPVIEKLLGEYQLESEEIEEILQRFTDRIGFIETRVCSLSPEKSGKFNAELLARWSPNSIGEIAVPFSIRERAVDAHKRQFTLLGQAAGYVTSVLSGVGTLAASVALTVIANAGYRAYETGDLFTLTYGESYGGSLQNRALYTAFAVGAALSTAVAAKKGFDHYQVVQKNIKSTNEELNACASEMHGIYDGMAGHLKEAPPHERTTLANALKTRLPGIREKIAAVKVVPDSKEILGTLEQALNG